MNAKRIVGLCLWASVFSLAMLTPGQTPSAWADTPTEEAERRQAKIDARVKELIEQLGSTDFALREKAQRELTQIGLDAFDALQVAQFHPDLEVQLRARYLIGSADIAWMRDDDQPQVKAILKPYGKQNEHERKTSIELLGDLGNREGLAALCRLARYEKEEWLSKQAALEILEQEAPTAEEAETLQRQLQLGAGQSRRTAAGWLRAYARSLKEPETILPEWNRLVEEEFDLLKLQQTQTNYAVATALGRWHAATLFKLGHAQDMEAIVSRLEALLTSGNGERTLEEKLLEHVDWLGHSEMWPQVVNAQERYSAGFEKEPLLLYRLAEAQRKLGENEAAAKTAVAALELNADNFMDHVKAGQELATRGLLDWAEAEFRYVQKNQAITELPNVWSRFTLSELLHDQEREREAAEMLQPIATALNDDINPAGKRNSMEELLARMGRTPGTMLSRMKYFYALDHLKRNEFKKGVELLREGLNEDAKDADVLIALYRLPNQTDAQKAETRTLITSAVDTFREQITEYGQNLEQLQLQLPPDALEGYKRQLAMSHNQMAWLVSNTEGDFEAAIASSHESLKLVPGQGAYLDTLGRCYYANGDLANAIKYQSEAVRKDPYSATMRRQLEMFQAAAKKE